MKRLSGMYLCLFLKGTLSERMVRKAHQDSGGVKKHDLGHGILDSDLHGGIAPDLWRWVDVFVGSGQHGHTFPGATTPWGMVQATPWTHSAYSYPWDTQSGYHTGAPLPRFFGMAHTALSGAGTGELGELRLLPCDLETNIVVLEQNLTEASPGYFATTVRASYPDHKLSNGIRIESSATPHGAIHKFSFNASTTERKVKLLLSQAPGAYYGYQLREYWHQVVSEKRFEGCAESLVSGFGDSMSLLCYVIEFDQPFLPLPDESARKASPDVTFDFSQDDEHQLSFLIARVSVSRTSVANARSAFSREVEGRSLADVVRAARQSWDQALSVIQVDLEPSSRKKTFYSALYHTMLAPNLLSDFDGSYRLQGKSPNQPYRNRGSQAMGFKEVDERMPLRQAEGYSQYGTFSLWDTYRSLHPLMNLVHPGKSHEFAQSLLAFADAWNFLPGFELLASPSDMMGGDAGSIVLSQMAMQGLVEKERAFEILNQTRRVPVDERKYLNRKMEIGDDIEHSVSKALEQGMADKCVSRVASSLHLKHEEAYFLERAQLTRQYWDPVSQVYSPLHEGVHRQFLGRDDLSKEMDAYTEGTPLQYAWGAQYDVQWQLKQYGDVKDYVCALDYLFEAAPAPNGGDQNVAGDIHGASLGNEPSMHIPYLYSLVGHPSRTQDVLDEAVKTLFSDQADGLPGNDDMGQMSSWLVFTMLGFYPVDPCSNDVVLGRPFITDAKVSVRGGTLNIIVRDQAEENKYIKNVQWEGQPVDLSKPVLSLDTLSKGGVLEFWMSNQPTGPTYQCGMTSVWKDTKQLLGAFWHSLENFFLGSSMEA